MKNSQNNGKQNIATLFPPDIIEDLSKVEEKLKEVLLPHPPLIEKIGRHVLESGGKRLRPALHLISSRISKFKGKDPIDVAASTELVHTASLLHDDVIDSSLTRRGKPTANTLWGNKSSILMGDYLLSQCLNILVKVDNHDIVVAFSRVFHDLSIGEMLELVNEHNLDTDLDTYLEIISKKTSSLFKLCMEAGALYNGKHSPNNGVFSGFGTNFGISFQLKDDFLDYFGDAARMGKPIMWDFKEKKITFPLIKLRSLCSDKERESLEEIFYQLKIEEPEELVIKKLMEKYRIDELAMGLTKEYGDKAYKDIKNIDDSPYKDTLLNLLEYNLSRDR